MTLGGWISAGILCATAMGIAITCAVYAWDTKATILSILIGLAVSAAIIGGGLWIYNNTEAGKRALVDSKINLQGGLQRDITVYTADGQIIAKYSGQIDISTANGYVKFDLGGKRYIYYNCFVESIADIE